MKKRAISLFVAAILFAAVFTGCNRPIDNPEFTSAPNEEKIITKETAKRAAAERANLSLDDIQFTKLLLDTDDGKKEYDIKFNHNGYEYEIEVDAADGSINSYEREPLDDALYSDDKNKSDKEASVNTSKNPVSEEASAAMNDEISVGVTDISESIPDISVEASEAIVSSNEPIGEDEALRIAMTKAELPDISREDLAYCRIKLDRDDGRYEYEIDFGYNGHEYDITVNAHSGEITEFEREKEKSPSVSKEDNSGSSDDKNEADISSTPSISEPSVIDEASALSKALEHAKLTEADISFTHIKLETDDGRSEYEIEFVYGYDEYDYEIDAYSGEIRDFDRDAEHCQAPEHPAETKFITAKDAKAVAFCHAGVTEEEVFGLEVEFDEDDGIHSYEIEFKHDGYEYKYDISAADGSILESEKDFDD